MNLIDDPVTAEHRKAFEQHFPRAKDYRAPWTVTGYIGEWYPTCFMAFCKGRESVTQTVGDREPKR
jgi:hypothetical protein